MKRYLALLLCVVSFISCLDHPLKVLHITFHEGCMNDFEEVGREVALDVTSWFVQRLPEGFWEGSHTANEIYNVGPRRAARVWERHKDYFNTFDAIVTSDTAPLSRIFLQHNWKKPLIIWVCNRFDYAHGNGGEDRFPDKGYYDLIRKAATMPNVRIIPYTPFEHEHARRKGVNIGTRTIKPLGTREVIDSDFKSAVPTEINKSESLFIFPRLAEGQINAVKTQCAKLGMPSWSGVYSGPEDLKGFKGVLFFPYAYSNLALFENLQRGVVHFVPTIRFLTQLGYIRGGMHGNLQWSEWYFDEFKDVLVYFDSWEDLKHKVATTDYSAMHAKVKAFGGAYREGMVREWGKLFDEVLGRLK